MKYLKTNEHFNNFKPLKNSSEYPQFSTLNLQNMSILELHNLIEYIHAVMSEKKEEMYNIPIEELEISVRLHNILKKNQINTVGDVFKAGKHNLYKNPNFGEYSWKELVNVIYDLTGVILK